ncbi:MAG TPA: hypothetical protein VF522_04770 [Ramlibacter sp.]|uniref:hypothetical protein n=1 Tax=Ramlibacter sp. TaxID=1917967 RepID=UPI002ED355FA
MMTLHTRSASRLALLATALLVSACATGSRLGPQKVLSSTPDTIAIEWDRWQISDAAVRSAAVLHCNGRPVEEVGTATKPHSAGLVRSRTWRCLGI